MQSSNEDQPADEDQRLGALIAATEGFLNALREQRRLLVEAEEDGTAEQSHEFAGLLV